MFDVCLYIFIFTIPIYALLFYMRFGRIFSLVIVVLWFALMYFRDSIKELHKQNKKELISYETRQNIKTRIPEERPHRQGKVNQRP